MEFEAVASTEALASLVTNDDLARWLRERGTSPYRGLPGLREEQWIEHHLGELRRTASHPDGITLWFPDIPLLVAGRKLAWDTELLGITIGRLDYLLHPDGDSEEAVLRALQAACAGFAAQGWELIIHKTSPADPLALRFLARSSFDLLAVHLQYVLGESVRGNGTEHALRGYEFGVARPDDELRLGELSAANNAEFDRYRIDSLLPQDKVTELYREWARNSLRGYADLVWVARREGEVVAFGTWSRLRQLSQVAGVGCAEYGIAAVARGERRRGLFTAITAGALERLAVAEGVRWATAATNVLNTPVQRAFQSLGGRILAPILTYRKDLRGGGRG